MWKTEFVVILEQTPKLSVNFSVKMTILVVMSYTISVVYQYIILLLVTYVPIACAVGGR